MIRSREKIPVKAIAPTATGIEADVSDATSWPTLPPESQGIAGPLPLVRPLKIYAFGPTMGRRPGNVRTLNVRYEPLQPGPVGERIAVVDYDPGRRCYYEPVNLDDPLIAINGGLAPSESDPRFHQQMVYAVVSECLRRVDVALGRTARRRSTVESKPLRLVVYPHA